jgi:hypothetical protein
MGRHKETYAAKWEADRQVTIIAEEIIRNPLRVQSGDPGRAVALGLTMQELESLMKAAHEALHRHRAEQLRREFSKRESNFWQREWDLKRQLGERDRRIDQLDRRTKELEEAIDSAHAVAHKDQAAATGQADPFAFVERPDTTAKLH